jgi:acyl-CoA synthetase (AMP-forming)/AMP-acid ligase II
MLQRLLDAPGVVPSLRVAATSGSSLPIPVAQRFMDRFGDVIYNLYGSTEASWASIATPAELRAAPGCAGRPPRGTRVAIVGDDGRPVPPGVIGRIFVGNDMLFEGYTGGEKREYSPAPQQPASKYSPAPQQPASKYSPAPQQPASKYSDGMISTGDLGHVDSNGLLFVDGREDDMVISGGENVYPSSVEALLAELPQVREVAVAGVPDPEYGQRLAAWIALRDGEALDPDAVREYVRHRLARFFVPRDVHFVDALPRNATGKVLLRQLKGRSPH